MSDQVFEDVILKVNDKLKEAADALKEATRLAKEAGLPALIPAMYLSKEIFCSKVNRARPHHEVEKEWEDLVEKIEKVNVRDFECALSNAGWSASASYC